MMWKTVAAHPGVSMATGLRLVDGAGTVTSLVSFRIATEIVTLPDRDAWREG